MTMFALQTPALVRARVNDTARRIAIAIDRFPRKLRPMVKRLSARHQHLADLALSFPGLLFALAVPRTGVDPEPAIAAAIDGHKLAHVARLADVPMWLRNVRPEAFEVSLPVLPDSDLFRRRIANHLPAKAKDAAAWLRHVAEAWASCDEAFALWVAREVNAYGTKRIRAIHSVGLWAWFCAHPGCFAHDLVTVRWSQDMSYPNAVKEADAWRERAIPFLNQGFGALDDTWLTPRVIGDLSIEPLTTARALADAAKALENCAASYCQFCNCRRLWVVRRGNAIVAMLEIHVQIICGVRHPSLGQIRGAKNENAAFDVQQAVMRWIGEHPCPAPSRMEPRKHVRDYVVWRALWRPYWLAKRAIPKWLPLAGDEDDLWSL